MSTVLTSQPWSPRALNQSGIRRLKLADSNQLKLIIHAGLVPQSDLTLYEFIFPADLSCLATFTAARKESGSQFWQQAVNWTLPHKSEELINWVASNPWTRWIAILEDYNGSCFAMGGNPEGLELSFQASSGSSPRDGNPMAFSLSAEQFIPFNQLPAYDDGILFPNNAGFSYGFSTGFNS